MLAMICVDPADGTVILLSSVISVWRSVELTVVISLVVIKVGIAEVVDSSAKAVVL